MISPAWLSAVAALASAFAAWSSGRTGRLQAEIARWRRHDDLYDRRFKIYKAFSDFRVTLNSIPRKSALNDLKLAITDGQLTAAHVTPEDDIEWLASLKKAVERANVELQHASFLLTSETYRYLDDVFRDANWILFNFRVALMLRESAEQSSNANLMQEVHARRMMVLTKLTELETKLQPALRFHEEVETNWIVLISTFFDTTIERWIRKISAKGKGGSKNYR